MTLPKGRAERLTLLVRPGGDDLFVEVLVYRDDAGGAEVILRGVAGSIGHRLQPLRMIEEAERSLRHGVNVSDGKEKAVAAVFDEFGDTADLRGNGGNLAGHGLESSEAERLHLRRHKHEVG